MGKKPADQLPDDDVQPDPPSHEETIQAWAASARNAAKNCPDGINVKLECVMCHPDGYVVLVTGDPEEAEEAVRSHAEENKGAGTPHRLIAKPVTEDTS